MFAAPSGGHCLDPAQQQQGTALRHESCTMRRIARDLATPLSRLGRWLKAQGLGRLKNLQPKEPVRRYQWAHPGDMIHIDTKQLARFERVGYRITGDRRKGCSPGASYEKAHVAVDDATRLGYVEVLPDEQKATTVDFLVRAEGWFNNQGITCRRVLSDNGSAYRSRQWRQACTVLGLKAKRTRAYRPQTNGKAERFIKTLQASEPMQCRTPVQKSASAGCRATWRSITAADATWAWQAALPLAAQPAAGH